MTRTRRFRQGEVVDFVVVGAGAAGGVMAKELATAGFTVLVLEQGPRLRPEEFEHDEFKTFFQGWLSNTPTDSPQRFRQTPADEWQNRQGVGYHRLVGGGSVMFT